MCTIIKWKRPRRKHTPSPSPDSQVAASKELRRRSTSYWNGIYDDHVRTDSYNEFLLRVQIVASQAIEVRDEAASCSSHIVEGILDPNQEKVNKVLGEKEGRSEILDLAASYFENSRKASRLCGALLESVREARGQCREMEAILAGMSGEVQQQGTADGLQKAAEAANPFGEVKSSARFEEVRGSYGALSREVEESKREVGSNVKAVKCCRTGTVGVVVAVLAGATVVAVVVATHAVAGLAAAPAAGMAVASRAKKTRQRGREEDEGKVQNRRGTCELQRLGLGFWRKRRAQLDALGRGGFTEDRMLDTLRCLVDGLHEDLERNRRLVIFGRAHLDESLCVQQVTRQLAKSHAHLTQQLSDLEEQVVVSFMVINKTRDWVLQEFS